MCHLCCCTCAYELMLPSEGHPHTVHPTCHCRKWTTSKLMRPCCSRTHECIIHWFGAHVVPVPCIHAYVTPPWTQHPHTIHSTCCPLSTANTFGVSEQQLRHHYEYFAVSKFQTNNEPASTYVVPTCCTCAYKSMAHTFPTPSSTTNSFAAFKRWLSSFRKFIVWHSKVPKCIVDV